MVKQAEQNRLRDKKGVTLERNTIIDDSLLPNAEELAKLNNIDNKILPWILERTVKEQDARIQINKDRMMLAKSENNHVHWYNFTALFMAFFIVILFLGLSTYLLLNDHEIIGTIFCGATLAMIVSYFLQAKSRK